MDCQDLSAVCIERGIDPESGCPPYSLCGYVTGIAVHVVSM